MASLTGFGAIQQFLDDPSIEEIWINAHDRSLSTPTNLGNVSQSSSGKVKADLPASFDYWKVLDLAHDVIVRAAALPVEPRWLFEAWFHGDTIERSSSDALRTAVEAFGRIPANVEVRGSLTDPQVGWLSLDVDVWTDPSQYIEFRISGDSMFEVQRIVTAVDRELLRVEKLKRWPAATHIVEAVETTNSNTGEPETPARTQMALPQSRSDLRTWWRREGRSLAIGLGLGVVAAVAAGGILKALGWV